VAYLKPGFFLNSVVNPLLAALRIKPLLVVAGRKTGNFYEIPVNVLEHEGKRYLVSPRGETEWSRNMRAAGEGELRTRKGTEPITVVAEVADEAKPDLIAAYRAKWDSQTKRYWEQLPEPSDHPVFEIATRT
jgi:deazaflavin-dependent oxidoreductase (nitroreductase family)